jgi:hypothetical protein
MVVLKKIAVFSIGINASLMFVIVMTSVNYPEGLKTTKYRCVIKTQFEPKMCGDN